MLFLDPSVLSVGRGLNGNHIRVGPSHRHADFQFKIRNENRRRLGTSPTQIYRLLDEENTRKSLDRVFELLSVLQCRIDIHSINGQANGTKTDKPVLRLTFHG
jgi:hypothetical protein